MSDFNWNNIHTFDEPVTSMEVVRLPRRWWEIWKPKFKEYLIVATPHAIYQATPTPDNNTKGER